MLISAAQHGSVGWIPRPGLTDLRVLFHDYFGAATVVAVLLAVCAAAALAPPPGTWRRRRAAAGQAAATPEPAWWRSGGISLPSMAAPLLLVPAAILIVESLVAVPLYADRYVLFGEAGAALLAGAGLCRAGRWLRDTAPAGPMRQESMVLERDFSLIAERHFRGVLVTLWLRRCPLTVAKCGFGLS